MTTADIIDALGGVAAVSRALNIPPTTVGNWRARNSIPARHHQAILTEAGGRVTAEQIIAAHSQAEAI